MKNISEETMMDVKDTASYKLDKLKGQVEYLNMKMHLGVKESKDEYEVQKKNLNNWIESAEQKLSNLEGSAKETANELRKNLDTLKLQAALGKAETEDALKEQQKKIESQMHEIKQKATKLYNSSSENARVIASEIETQVDNYHTRFDLLGLRMKLGAADAGDLWESKKKEFSSKLNEINSKLNNSKVDASEKLSKMSGELSESWKHFKGAFNSKS